MDSNQLASSISLGNGQSISIDEPVVAPVGQPGVDISGDNARLDVNSGGSIAAPDQDNTGVSITGNNANVTNSGEISGAFNGISSEGNSFTLDNQGSGVISSDSRAVDVTDGDNVTINNSGSILGTGNQRNGTLYIDGTVDNFNLNNSANGVIDAGAGNNGDGLSVQVGAEGDTSNQSINLANRGVIAGRGTAEFAAGEGRLTGNGASGVRYFNGLESGEATVTGDFINTGAISAEVNVGFLGGFVVEDGVSYQGTIRNSGSITGPNNGLYLGDANHQLLIANENSGRIESGSRALNLDGDNIQVQNDGSIVGTGDQRNGTLYVDGTGDNIDINNNQSGVIDAGAGNSGSGVSVQVGTAEGLPDGSDDLETSVDVVNNGLIQGRGGDNVPAGLRLFVDSGLETSTFTGNITNQNNGVIASEQDAGILIEPGIEFNGQIVNEGTISGGNGLAIDAAGAFGSVDVINNGSLEGDVFLGEGNDSLINNSSDDLNITGGSGDDTLTGGAGVNVYDFAVDSGQDIITDFQTSQDVLDLGSYFDSANQALRAATQDGSDVLIDLDADNSITLTDTSFGDLSASNFLF